MKTTTFILFIVTGLSSCTHKQTITEMPLREKMKGNWKTEYFKGAWKETAYIFTFQDSTCTYLHPWGEYSNYWINGDTLNIKERIIKWRDNERGGKITYKFLVDSITSDNLTLKPITEETKKLLDNYENEVFDKIHLIKIKSQFDWKTERIGFYSTVCFGTCPSMYFEIDSVGNILFNGKYFTEKEGFYSGKLSAYQFEIIKSEVNSIRLDSLNKMYSANWTDDQTCGVIIKTSNTTYKSSAYGFDKEPIELRILFHRLMELYKNVELKKDTTIQEKFKFKGVQ
ncbi:DUF6438 domain-containing protein [Marinilongibacter aquaticus]|uniref:DUF6438 domain-containing protein n=1 Tax=Marinilongibacter aquaticus TaxID=2975157 RepID=UPI0021BDA9FA|nr:DUF6438 domain-containing protein [Marinilongibacter aquaticus]UBM58686.1 DUF6438 domain-containing protein [Marinilongibacter aquaticus]